MQAADAIICFCNTEDAKVWPGAHPHGTGSLYSEIGAGSPQQYARNRACCVQSWFRKTALWAFWKLDCLIKQELFRSNYRKTRAKSDDPNVFTRLFGSTVPKNIPESAALSIASTAQNMLLLGMRKRSARSGTVRRG